MKFNLPNDSLENSEEIYEYNNKKNSMQSSHIRVSAHKKSVKNINLRIKQNGTACVSANPQIPVSFIDEFVKSKSRETALPEEVSVKMKELLTKYNVKKNI
jgi:ABC-type Zn2+ transport system substrate-binding protein/surface adhesin